MKAVPEHMTEAEMVAEIDRIAALSTNEITLELAQYSGSLRNSLSTIRAARVPLPPPPQGN